MSIDSGVSTQNILPEAQERLQLYQLLQGKAKQQDLVSIEHYLLKATQ